MIKQLPYRKAITIRREIYTEGHSPLEIIADDYKIYFIKSAQNQNPCFYIINEFLCHYLLKCWHIPTPSIAAISLDPILIHEGLSDRHKKHFYEQLCFGSQSIKDPIDLNAFFNANSRPSLNRFLNPEILFKIALFDIWVENDDRKPSNNNIILQPVKGKLNILALDHAFTFSSMGYLDLNSEFVASSFNDTILLSAIGQSIKSKTKINKKWVKEANENFYLCISNCEKKFTKISKCIPEHFGFDLRLQEKLHSFLFNKERNKKVFEEFTTRLK